MPLTVTGTAMLRVDYSVQLDYTEDQWESFGLRKQNEILDAAIDWASVTRNAEVDDIDVDEYGEG